MLNIDQQWRNLLLEHNFHFWFNNVSNHKTLPIFISWGIWNAINSLLFDDKSLVFYDIYVKILSLYKDSQSCDKSRPKGRLILDIPSSQEAIGYFDGDAQDRLCAVGVYLLLNETHTFKMKLNCG